MLKEFIVTDDGTGVLANGRRVDLHNNYDLSELRLRLKDRALELEFVVAVDAASRSPRSVVLQFLDVDSIQLSNGILSVDEPYVDDLGYKEPSDTDYDSVMRERDASPAAHFFLRVGGDEFVRVQARRAKAILSAE